MHLLHCPLFSYICLCLLYCLQLLHCLFTPLRPFPCRSTVCLLHCPCPVYCICLCPRVPCIDYICWIVHSTHSLRLLYCLCGLLPCLSFEHCSELLCCLHLSVPPVLSAFVCISCILRAAFYFVCVLSIVQDSSVVCISLCRLRCCCTSKIPVLSALRRYNHMHILKWNGVLTVQEVFWTCVT